jgi:hypothetical protein
MLGGTVAALSEGEQKAVGADYQAVSQTEGVTPGVWMEHPETATTVRVANGGMLTTGGERGARRLSLLRGGEP